MNLLFCKLIFAVLLLLMEAYGTAGISNRSATLHPQDVGVVNALLKCLRRPEWEKQIFKADSCNVTYTKEVTCDCSFENNKTCQVTKIDFSNHGLKGRIPTEIGKLTSLQYLDLSSNNLRGTIPESFGNLSQLVLLVLSTNQLRGSIPESFGNLSQLVFLDLYGNYLDGPIPPSLGNLKKLKEMHLSNNWFDGSIPETLGDLPSLVYLILYNNQLSGPLRPRLGHLKNLQYLILYDNELSGELPHSFMELKNLSVFHIGGNNFTGRVPEFIGNWKNLQTFSITGNNFIGRVPEFIANLIHLESMSLVGNSFEGPLPTNISSLTNLRYLAISDLSSEGSRADRESLFPNIEGMTSLRRLILRNCLLIGPLPGSLGQIQSLNHLKETEYHGAEKIIACLSRACPDLHLQDTKDLSFNRLIGEIPHFVIIPRYIFLRRNTLNGTLPQWMTELNDSSRYRDVSENNLMNAIPPVYASQKNLNLFSCCSNTTNMIEKWQKHGDTCNDALNDQLYINCGGEAKNISRTTYEADLENTGGSTFFLSENKNWGYSSMGTYIQEGTDRFIVNETSNITMVDAPLYTTARIAPISLKYYGFCLKNGNYTVKLHFAEIAWDAKKDSSNKWKRIFDVEIQNKKVFRNFNIEKEARGVHKDVVPEFNITVTDNRLEIHLYWAGKGSLYGPDYSHGPLISAISVSPQALELASKKHGLSAMKIGGIVGSALLLALLILLLFWKMGWLGGKDPHGEELKGIELLPGRFFNYRQIKAATQNFSTVNKLGEGGFGSVYKGALPDGTAIAVKQLSAKSKQGIREFVNEIGTISALRHPNLVRLMGCCAEDNQLLLVYEYMENNSLHHALFGSDELKLRLNWPTRVKICLGIAKGLAFLHEESKLRIVHRDIKPTNILLDKDLNAKISDFGFAKLYEEEKTHVITRIAGTTGYMAPEYAMRGHLTNKADVYSFGVVTLEIFSGKNSTSYRPNDQSVYLLDLAYVLQEKGNLIALVDPALGSNYAWKEAVIILDLAMLCTNPSPTLRPTMSEVVKILEGKSKIKTTSTSAPYSVDDFAMAKTIAGLSQSTPSGSTSQEGASDIALYNAVGKEIEEPSISTDNSIETITEQGGRIGKEMP